MSTTTAPETVEAPRELTLPRAVGWGAALLVAVPVIAHVPLLVQHGRQLWLRPHYQFFPLVFVGAAVLAYTRLRSFRPVARGNPWLAGAGLAAAWLLLAAAELLDSSWLGTVAVLGLLPVLAYAVGGAEAVRRSWPAWALLWLVVPPPLELDRNFILGLQAWTSRWSSAALDALGVFHVRAGNVIETDGRKLMVEQACSGINSLFSVLACTLFVVLLTRRGAVRGALLLAAAVGWVLVANVARVVAVAVLETRWGIDASTSWRHEALGLLLFAAAVGLLLSTDQLLAFLSHPTPSGPAPAPAPVDPPPARRPAGVGRLGGLAAVAATAYLTLFGLHWALAGRSPAAAGAPPPLADDRDLLPAAVEGWERTEFASQARDSGSFFGERSQVWTYRRGDRTVLVSLDYPFPSWHDLTRCYTGQGWQVDAQAVRAEAGGPGGCVEVRLSKPAYRSGYLLFCEFDRAGRPLQARPGGPLLSTFRHASTFRRVWARLGGEAEAEAAADPPGAVYQLQLFAESYSPLTDEEEASVRSLLLRAQGRVREAWGGPGR
jgi:exosortase